MFSSQLIEVLTTALNITLDEDADSSDDGAGGMSSWTGDADDFFGRANDDDSESTSTESSTTESEATDSTTTGSQQGVQGKSRDEEGDGFMGNNFFDDDDDDDEDEDEEDSWYWSVH